MRSRLRRCACLAFVAASVGAVASQQKPPLVQQITINGGDLPYVDQGKGAPVVFVHGAVADLRYWEPQRSAFVGQHRFISYSFRYHDTGPWSDGGKLYTAEQHAADLAAFISQLKAGPVHLVGLSYGGVLAAMVAVKSPELLRTLTLAEPALFSLLGPSAEDQAALEEWNKGSGPMIEAIKAGDNVKATRHISALVTGGPPDTFDKLPAALRRILLDNARTMPLLFAAPPPVVTCDMLQALRTPTLIVRGERTPRVFRQINDATARCIAGSTLVVIPKASHTMSYDNPAEFNRVVIDFVSRKPAGD
jgi:pimeloyl-ACP methyl ester carboxylesterase